MCERSWTLECPVCGESFSAGTLYQHCYTTHLLRMRDLREYGLGRVTCPTCGETVALSQAANHRCPERDPEPARLEPHSDGPRCSRCGTVVERTYDRAPYCELRCPGCAAWWPLTSGRAGAPCEPVDDATWIGTPGRETAYLAACLTLERIDAYLLLFAHVDDPACRSLAATIRLRLTRVLADHDDNHMADTAWALDGLVDDCADIRLALPRRPRRPLDPRRLTGQGRSRETERRA